MKTSNKEQNVFYKLRMGYSESQGTDINQTTLSKLIGVGRTHISELESGYRVPSKKELKLYEKFFQIDLSNYSISQVLKEELSLEKTIEILRNSNSPDEQALYNTVCTLLTSSKGLLILFYISEFLCKDDVNSDTTLESLSSVLKQVQSKEKNLDKYSYAELRAIFDHA